VFWQDLEHFSEMESALGVACSQYAALSSRSHPPVLEDSSRSHPPVSEEGREGLVRGNPPSQYAALSSRSHPPVSEEEREGLAPPPPDQPQSAGHVAMRHGTVGYVSQVTLGHVSIAQDRSHGGDPPRLDLSSRPTLVGHVSIAQERSHGGDSPRLDPSSRPPLPHVDHWGSSSLVGGSEEDPHWGSSRGVGGFEDEEQRYASPERPRSVPSAAVRASPPEAMRARAPRPACFVAQAGEELAAD